MPRQSKYGDTASKEDVWHDSYKELGIVEADEQPAALLGALEVRG